MFHHESDHTVGGFRYEIEAQIIYKSDDVTKAGKKAMVSVLFHSEVGEKNKYMEAFAFDMLNGYNLYEGDKALDLTWLFESGSGGGKQGAEKKEECPKISTNTSEEKGADLGTVVKFD